MPHAAHALLLAALATPALAQGAADADVRCILAANLFANAEKDPPKRQLALATGLFFSGRADARLSPAQLKAAIQAQGKALTVDTAPAVMTTCATTFQAKARGLQALGRQVAEGQAAAAKPAAAGPAKAAPKK